MRIRRPALLICLLLVLSTGSASLGALPGLRFDRLTVDDGLPDGQIHSVHQDRRGFLWISTRNGLGRYDGREFVLHRYDPNDLGSINGNWVGPLLEDPSGRLWIALGVGGMDRFDPETGVFEHIDLTPETDETNDIALTDMALDPSGAVWVATSTRGILRVRDRPSGVPDLENLRAADGLPHDNVSDLAVDGAGHLWIGTCGGGLAVRLGERFLTAGTAEGLSSPCPQVILPDELGAWVGSAAGVDRVTLQTWSGEHAELRVESFTEGQPSGTVGSLALDRRGRLWAGFNGHGFAMLAPQTRAWRVFAFAEPTGLSMLGRPRSSFINGVAFLHADEHGRVWVGSFGSGLYVYDPESDGVSRWVHDAADPQSLSSDVITTALFDHGGGLWIGTGGRGLSFYSPWRFKFGGVRWDPLERDGLSHPLVLSLAVDEDQLWIGTAAGLDRLDLAAGQTAAVELPQVTSSINALELDLDGHVWIGTSLSGLFRYDPAGGAVEAFAHDPADATTPSGQSYRSLRLAHDHRSLWLGSMLGFVDRLDLETGLVERAVAAARVPDGRQGSIWAIEQEDERFLWIGAPSLGLFRVDLETGESRRFKREAGNPRSINNRTVNSLLLDSRDQLWVGTFSGGLDRYDAGEDAFLHLTERDGLPSNMVESILEQPAGILWLATRHGLARYDPEKGEIESYYRRDGLVADGFATGAGARSPDGRLFFGGLGGVVSFRPDEVSSNRHVPPVALTRFRRQGAAGRHVTALDGVDEVAVEPGDRVFGFSFAALDFADPERNRFAYRLEGFDDDWIDAGTVASASYTNIDPGRYVFHVRGSNADGLWNVEGASIRVLVKPRFWQTGWFHGLQALLAAILLAAAYRWQRRHLLARERRQQERLDHERKSRELLIARRMQRALLPREDYSHPRIEVAGRHRTASEVGGDYFDVIEHRGQALCIAIGDAVGHGMAAGFVVSMVKAGLLNALRAEKTEPASILSGLDAMLRDAAPSGTERGRLVSMGLAVAMIELNQLELELASVAMPYPYVWRQDSKSLETLEIGGLPLGQRLGQRPRGLSLRLQPDDLLIFASDGLVERRNRDDEPWGFEALEASIAELCSKGILTPAALCNALLAACDLWADGHEADDDMTVLAVRARGPHRRADPVR